MPAQGGVYLIEGRIATGDTVHFAGRVIVGQPGARPSGRGALLQSPTTAEVHVAIAPHGQLDVSSAVTQLTTPLGSATCGCWWVGRFQEPAALSPEPEFAIRSDVVNQGGEGIYAANGAEMSREERGLLLRVSMPVPEPGSYTYPSGGAAQAEPEVFSAWAFVFNCARSSPATGKVNFGTFRSGAFHSGGLCGSGSLRR